MEEQSVVLVVDDVKTNVLIMRQCLKEMFQVWTAESGEEGLRQFEKENAMTIPEAGSNSKSIHSGRDDVKFIISQFVTRN